MKCCPMSNDYRGRMETEKCSTFALSSADKGEVFKVSGVRTKVRQGGKAEE